MATIVINDLPESTELDRKAMLAISGGARFGAGAKVSKSAATDGMRLFKLSGATQPKGAQKCHP